jgi:5-formyltetrahydrofolate cyclo-ligase
MPATSQPQSDAAIAQAKAALRRRMREARVAVPPAALAEASARITERLLELPALRDASVVAAFVSLADEIDTGALIRALASRGCAVLLPVLSTDKSLLWREYAGHDALVAGRLGLLEPSTGASAATLGSAQVVVVPGVCYDAAGRRLGRGGGSYDRALSELDDGVTLIGMALDAEIVEQVPVTAHDETVHIVVTPSRVVVADR